MRARLSGFVVSLSLILSGVSSPQHAYASITATISPRDPVLSLLEASPIESVHITQPAPSPPPVLHLPDTPLQKEVDPVPRSYNGFPASQDPAALGIVTITPVPGRNFQVVGGDVATIFTYLIQQYNARVEPIIFPGEVFDDWSYGYRADVNDPTMLSCHSSGTAVDLNATRHPNNTADTRTLNAGQINEIMQILDELEGAVTWGGDPGGPHGWEAGDTSDPMHWEITDHDLGLLARVAAKVRPLLTGGTAVPTAPVVAAPAPTITVSGVSVKQVQERLNANGAHLAVDGVFGAMTSAAVKAFQKSHSLAVDGIVGPKTWAILEGGAPPYPLTGGQVFGTADEPGWAKLTRSGDPRYDGPDIRADIRIIQDRLNHYYTSPSPELALDGLYGPATRRDVVLFQRLKGLSQDGMVGPATWKALWS